ncbi:MAG: general secretion pathway protein GspM [Sphingomonas sp. 28-66-16]|nr:MAG: general secretion pathway protein GspM [Sphingomonas sp. 28-66-16]
MIAALRSWFSGRSLREQRLILVALALAAVTVLSFGIIRPVEDGLAAAKARQRDAVLRLATTESQLRALTELQRDRPPPLQAPLDSEIRARAAAAGFVLSNVAPQANNAVLVAIASARPSALFGWIGDLERSGILVESLTTTDNGDQTISVQLSVKARGI